MPERLVAAYAIFSHTSSPAVSQGDSSGYVSAPTFCRPHAQPGRGTSARTEHLVWARPFALQRFLQQGGGGGGGGR